MQQIQNLYINQKHLNTNISKWKSDYSMTPVHATIVLRSSPYINWTAVQIMACSAPVG